MRNAFRIANEGRKGPVLVDITKDVTAADVEYNEEGPLELARVTDDELDKRAKKFAKYINEAKKPVLYLGGGIISAEASGEVRAYDKGENPFCNSMMASGVAKYDTKYSYGMVGMHGSYAANKCISEAGSDFRDKGPGSATGLRSILRNFGENARIIQIDIDKSEVNKNVMVVESIIADCKDALEAILPLVDENNHDEWVDTIDGWNREHPLKMKSMGALSPQDVVEEAYKFTAKMHTT